MKIQMVDLKSQYNKIKSEIDKSILEVISSSKFINGPDVKRFEENLKSYLNVNNVIPCANGTDALQIALMALDLEKDSEIICPSFTYVATAEVISLLGFKPVMADVDFDTFNIKAEHIENLINDKTRAIVPVHLFGQSCDMEPILDLAKKHNLYVIEDNAQAIGANYYFDNGKIKKTGTMGDIGTTSFFPSKNLGCYGDGGALFTNDEDLAKKIRMIANHGQEKKYFHKITGCNSRLDSIQAAILNIKLKKLDEYSMYRNKMADEYDKAFNDIEEIIVPKRSKKTDHVFHQYTIKIDNKVRKSLVNFLNSKDIPSMIYYPVPLYKQEAFSKYVCEDFTIPNIEKLCDSVLSFPIHSEFENSNQDIIISSVRSFFKK